MNITMPIVDNLTVEPYMLISVQIIALNLLRPELLAIAIVMCRHTGPSKSEGPDE